MSASETANSFPRMLSFMTVVVVAAAAVVVVADRRVVIGGGREAVADAAHRLDVRPGGAQLLAQALDVRVDGARGDLAAHPPDVVEQRRARLHAAPAFEQRRQQAQLEGGQRHLVVVDPDPMRVAVDPQLAEHQHAARAPGGRGRGAAQDRLDPQQQLAQAVGLDHVVVGAQLEPDHPIDLVPLGRDHDDGDVLGRRVALEPAADLHPRDVREHEIEQDQIGAVLGHRASASRPAPTMIGVWPAWRRL